MNVYKIVARFKRALAAISPRVIRGADYTVKVTHISKTETCLMDFLSPLYVEVSMGAPSPLARSGKTAVADFAGLKSWFKAAMVVTERSFPGMKITFTRPDSYVQKGSKGVATFALIPAKRVALRSLRLMGLFPSVKVPLDKLGGLSKYLNHGWVGKPTVVEVAIIANDPRRDGNAFCRRADFHRIVNVESLPGIWQQGKITQLAKARVVKPVLFGESLFAKGTLVPVSDEEWVKLGGSLEESPVPVVLADRNFVKFLDESTMLPSGRYAAWCGLHDAPQFAAGEERRIGFSTILRMFFDDLNKVKEELLANLGDLRDRLTKEGYEWLVSTQVEDSQEVLEKDKWISQAIFSARKAKEKLGLIQKKMFQYVFSLKARFISGYAVAPFGSIREDYDSGKFRITDLLVHPADYRVYARNLGVSAAEAEEGIVVTTIRFPKLHVHGAWKGRLKADARAPRGGIIVSEIWAKLGFGDYDGDTVSCYRFNSGVTGVVPLTRRVLDEFPEIKGKTLGSFTPDAHEVLASGLSCQALTGVVDSISFANQLQIHCTGRVLSPLLGIPEMQTILDGIKKPITSDWFSPIPSLPLWSKIVRGKDAFVGKVQWWEASTEAVSAYAPNNIYKDVFLETLKLAKALYIVAPANQGGSGQNNGPEFWPQAYSHISYAEQRIRYNGVSYDDEGYQQLIAVVTEMIHEVGGRGSFAPGDLGVAAIMAFISEGSAGTTRENMLTWLQRAVSKDLSGYLPELEYRIASVE